MAPDQHELIAELRAALTCASNSLLNAKIDLENGIRRKAVLRTIEGGLKNVHNAIAKAESQS
jgi:hypothetical protein